MVVTSGVALFNLIAQVVLVLGLLAGSWIARKRRMRQHCWLMRAAIVAQLLLTGVLMAPQMGRFFLNWRGFTGLNVELVIHHVFGLVFLALAIYINLAFTGVVKRPRGRRGKWVMRGALGAWMLSLALGIHLYGLLWR